MKTAADSASAGSGDIWTATGRERQVFLDVTGRRARRVRGAGALAAVVATGWLGGVVGGGTGFASLPALRASLVAHTAVRAVAPARVHHSHPRRGRVHPVELAEVSNRG
jgi:hypothetical protein